MKQSACKNVISASCVHNISYLRGVFHPSLFKTQEKYSMQVFVCSDEKMNNYVNKMVENLRKWLMKKEAHRLVLVLCDAITDERLERWQFDVQLEDELISNDSLVTFSLLLVKF